MAEIYKDRLHPEAVKHFETVIKLGAKPYYMYESLDELRKIRQENLSQMLEDVDFKGKVFEIRVPSKDVSEGIPTTVYQPSELAEVPCILVYFHGGGLVVGTRQDMDPMCKIVAQNAKCIVLNVEYRLSPEFVFPCYLNDAETVVRWTLGNKTRLGGKSGSPVGVAGDSAGGTLSACTAHDVPGLAFQVLIYPRVTYRLDFPSAKEFSNGPVLDQRLILWFETKSHPTDNERKHSRTNPLHREKFDHLPPVLFIVAELDPLRDESYAYKEKLEKAGVKCDFLEIKGVPHVFFTLNGIYKETTAEAYGRIVSFIKEFQQTASQ